MTSPTSEQIATPHPTPFEPRHLALALVALAALALSPVLLAPFLNWDDWQLVVENRDLHLDRWHSILGYWNPHNPHLALYIPLTYSAYFVLAVVSEATSSALSPTLFHATNLALHLLGGWLVWKLLRRICSNGWAAAIGAGVYLLHPIQVEAVAWVSSLSTVLAGTLAIAALLLFVRASEAADARAGRRYFVASCAVFLLAMTAKPSVCGLPLAALAIDRFILGRSWRVTLPRVAIWSALVVPILIAGRLAQPVQERIIVPLQTRPIVMLDTAGFYLSKFVIPYPLAIDYGRRPGWVATLPTSTLGYAAVSVAVFVVAILQRRRRPWLTAAVIIFIAGIGPVIGVVPFAFQTYSTVADRYAYPGVLGLAVAIAFASRGFRPRGPAAMICAAGLLALAIVAHVQTYAWQGDVTLFEHAIAVNPLGVPANGTLAFVQTKMAARLPPGEARVQLLAAAEANYARALAAYPQYAPGHYNLANMLANNGRPAEALDHYQAARDSAKENLPLELNWGVALAKLGRFDEALAHFKTAETLDPTSAEACANRGATLVHLEKWDEAKAAFSQALRINPTQPQALQGLKTLAARPAGGGRSENRK